MRSNITYCILKTIKNYIIDNHFIVALKMSAPNCPCPKRECSLHSDCEKCVEHHKNKDEMPFCAR